MNAAAVVRLHAVADINPPLGVAPSADEAVSFLPMAAVDADHMDAVDTLTRPFHEVSKGYTPFLSNDVLVAKITPCFENGKIAQAKPTHRFGFGSTEFHVIRSHNGELDPRYLAHFLRQPRIRIAGQRRMTGSAGQRRVPEHFLANLEIPLPPLPEQQRIAAILDAADALRAKRRAAIARLDELTQSIFLDMFGDPFADAHGWPVKPVSDFVAGFEAGRNLVADDEDDASSPLRVLKVSAVTSLRFRPGESKALPLGYIPPAAHFVRQGDLLFSRANTSELVGATALVDIVPRNLVLPDKLWRFRWYEEPRADARFVQWLFRQPKFRFELGRRATGTSGSMKNVSQEKVLGIRVALPPLALQQTFGRAVNGVDELRRRQERAACGADDLFASVQQRAFRGEL
jgi:type I restriction enzyme S subunit